MKPRMNRQLSRVIMKTKEIDIGCGIFVSYDGEDFMLRVGYKGAARIYLNNRSADALKVALETVYYGDVETHNEPGTET